MESALPILIISILQLASQSQAEMPYTCLLTALGTAMIRGDKLRFITAHFRLDLHC